MDKTKKNVRIALGVVWLVVFFVLSRLFVDVDSGAFSMVLTIIAVLGYFWCINDRA